MNRGWLIYGALLIAAAGLGLANRGSGPESPRPSIDNASGAGLKALYVYLQESGATVSRVDTHLDAAPIARTLVIAAPADRMIDTDEVEVIQAFVRAGGRLIYLAPRDFQQSQPAMTRWLRLESSGLIRFDELEGQLADLGGATATVWTPPGGAADISRLRVSMGVGITSHVREAVPAAGRATAAAALRWAEGKGEVWVFAGPDVAQNHRIGMLGNLAFWTAIAADGPIAFDELHHVPPPASGVPPAFVAIAAQLMFATLAYALSRGTRLGPPRAEIEVRHRSVLEYVGSMAWLTRRARVERDLAATLLERLRHTMLERAAVPLSASDAEAALQLEQHAQLPRDRTSSVLAMLRSAATGADVSSVQYLRCAQAAADLEAALCGRTPRE